MSSQCSCAWATFSFIVNFAAKGGRSTSRLMSMPASGHLLRGLSAAVCNHWPIMSVEEMPQPKFIPPPPEPTADDGSAPRTVEGWGRDAASPKDAKKAKRKKVKKSRKDIWREKTAKEKAKEKTAAKKKKAKEEEKKKKLAPISSPGDAGDIAVAAKERTGADAAAARGRAEIGGDIPAATASAAASDPAEAEVEPEPAPAPDTAGWARDDDDDDPIGSPANRLFLRTTAALALASVVGSGRGESEFFFFFQLFFKTVNTSHICIAK